MERNIEIIQTAIDKFDCASRKSSTSLLTYDRPKTFADEHLDEYSKTVRNSKIRHVKRESAYIQQKILDLQTCSKKPNEEIYGAGLLEAIKEFENFVATTWGRNRSCKQRQNNAIVSSNQLTINSPTSSVKLSNTTIPMIDLPQENPPNSPLQSTPCSNSEESEHDVCKLCQRMCPCKSQSVEKLPSKTTFESSSKAVNTEIEFIMHHTDTASSTAQTEVVLDPAVPVRSEPLSKLTIRIQNPITQQPDYGGEGNTSSLADAANNEEMKCVSLEAILKDANSSESTLMQDDNLSQLELEDTSCPMYPTEDMKAALKLVNDALLHGRTGKEVAASVSVILNEWFLRVGSKTARANDISNYLNTFQSYSSQLLRYMINIPNMSGITALHYAVSYGNYPVVSKLLDTNMTDPNKPNKAGYTSIMLASIDKITSIAQEQTIRQLISLGDVNIKAAQHGQTALMLAASNGNFRMVKLLLDAGADVNAQDEDGSTALMCAVEHGHADIVQCLLAQPGCDPNLTDNDGLTSLNIAMEADHKDVAVLLYAHMHFGTNASLSGTCTPNSQLLLSKRSKSTANAASFISDNTKNYERKSDTHFMARKQNSSIN